MLFFWDITVCQWVVICWCFKGRWCSHLQGHFNPQRQLLCLEMLGTNTQWYSTTSQKNRHHKKRCCWHNEWSGMQRHATIEITDILSKFFNYQLMHKRIALKRILKFILKQLLHVLVQSPSSGSVLFELAKVTALKIINQNILVWLIRWCGCIYIFFRSLLVYVRCTVRN
jgi:hypothetical protein